MLRTAAETGAYATVWSVLEVVLPHLAGRPGGPGHRSAARPRCRLRLPLRGEGRDAEVTAAAARTGWSQVVKDARLLRDVLG
ncbi:hypothetical protein [Streptomyces cavernae]|uniref:hypothetical protein n=1 Tax=Streptomyces cavernae TaxID=2259034 RepID=UPI001391100D|nr:hypothetical protein [Streptomyces cavernae]